MKKILPLIAFMVIFGCHSGWGQQWRDSLDYARSLYKKGAYEKALKYYKSAERLAPKGINLSEEKGQTAYRASKYSEAEKAFQQATGQTDTKRKSSAYNNLGSARMKQKNLAGAEEAFKNALRLNPSNEKARQNLAELKRIKQEEEKKKQQEQQQQKQDQKEQQNDNKGDQQKNLGDQQQKGQQQNPKTGQQKGNAGNQQNGKGDATPQNGAEQQKLADKQTDRKLDDLMRQEMETKKRLDGSKGSTHGKTAKKDW